MPPNVQQRWLYGPQESVELSVLSTFDRELWSNIDIDDSIDECNATEEVFEYMFKQYEFISDSKPFTVKGNLSRCIDFWVNTLNASPAVCDLNQNGYKLPFVSYPSKAFLDNNKSSQNEAEFVETAISELLINGCVEQLDTPPYCINPLTLAKGKKLRLVLDLRHVNKFLVKPKFKYENLKTLSQMFSQDYWFFTWDLKSGYHHVYFVLHARELCWSLPKLHN